MLCLLHGFTNEEQYSTTNLNTVSKENMGGKHVHPHRSHICAIANQHIALSAETTGI